MERKSLSLSDAQFKLESDGAGFVGYASTYGNVDSYGDTILKGAYNETLSKNGLPKMFFGHDSSAVPIGKWVKSEETDAGLLLSGEFTPGNSLAGEVRAALKHGTLDSLSIGYRLKKGDYTESEGIRTIKNVSLLAEVSVVAFPADKFARVDLASVKSYADEINTMETIKEFELFLRDAGQFSKGAAQALTARAKVLFGLRDAGESNKEAKEMAEILERIQRINA